MSSPPAPFSFLSFFPDLFSCSTAPQAFSRPDRHMVAGRRAQMLSRLAASSAATTLWGALAFTAIEHDGRLDGSGSITLLLSILSRLRVSARYSDRGCFLAGLATKSMARAVIASTYIRQLRSGLPRCCLHGRSRRRDGAHLSNGRLASANLRCGPTATHPTCPTHPTGLSELSALSTLSHKGRSLRDQTLLEITPEGNGELARDGDDHDALNAPVLPFGPLHKPLGNRALGLMFDPQPSYLDHGRPHGTAAGARDPLRALHLAAVIRARSQSQQACRLSSVAELPLIDHARHDYDTRTYQA